MNNYQNNFGKFVSPPTFLVSHIEYGSDQKKPHQDTRLLEKFDERKPSGGLKIFYESKNFKVDEPQFEWNFRNVKKKRSHIISLKSGSDGKKNKKKEKIKEGTAAAEDFKTPGFHFSEEYSRVKPHSVGSKKGLGPEQKILFNHYSINKNILTKNRETNETNPKTEPGTLANNLFTLSKQKVETEKKPEKSKITVKTKATPFLISQSLTRKTSEKSTTKMPEVKTTISDSGKRHINEILKSHAQKIPVKTIQIKDFSIQGLMEVQQKEQNNVTSTTELGKTGKLEEKTEGEKTKQESKTKEEIKEKKKMAGVWLKCPQSNELDRRLKCSWQDPSVFFSNGLEKREDRQEEDIKSEKRVTYTDRLLLLKALGKNLEEKKQKEGNETVQTKENPAQDNKIEAKQSSDIVSKKFDISHRKTNSTPLTAPLMQEVTTYENKEPILLKNLRESVPDHELKAKQTRSAELRDFVTQAIKEHKIFCIFDNHWYIVRPVREELLSRGWLEVIPDRRLIPRRRAPPMGPVFERDRSLNERNCNTLEAILAAKEIFVEEIQQTVSKSSLKLSIEKNRGITTATVTVVKKSEDSLSETLSQFRIIPPTSEKKKNNSEIREFVAKYQAYVDRGKERENEINKLREKEKNLKIMKKEKTKPLVQNTVEKSKSKEKTQSVLQHNTLVAGSKSFEEIRNTINDNRKVIQQAATEINSMPGLEEQKAPVGFLLDSSKKNVPAIEEKSTSGKPKPPGATSISKTVFSDSDAKMISKIIQSSNARIHFMWLSIKPGIHLKCFNYSPEIVNKFQKTSFCTKIGLWSHLNNMQWFAHEVHHPAKSPRMYNTGEADDLKAFFEDFQLTACIGMLKWLSDTFFEKGLKAVQTKRGKVPLKAFEFAIKQCERYMRFRENEELNLLEEPKVHQEEWNTFLQYFYIITNDNGKIQESSGAQLMVIYTKAVETLKTIRRHWPEIDIDGRLNIWIMKPYCASCGRGIFMTNNVYYIGQHSKYIVQKYIEKPLLIYNTKFDIRQWFMITKLTPLEIWMYKECYLRFCSQPFALRNLHESVHLSNNSVQRKYISMRDPNLPDQNMWDSNTFQLYLKTIGFPHAWDDIIYPGMKDAIVSTMLAAQDTFDGPRKSWFEVYGADFMLSANLKEGPWLIEINENPAMDPSTKVTARLCSQMLRDVIKVVVDKRSNKNASTGQWELIYRQNYSPSFGTVDLDVRGKKIARIPLHSKINSPKATLPKSAKKYDSREIGNNLYDFVKSYGTAQKGKEFNMERRWTAKSKK